MDYCNGVIKLTSENNGFVNQADKIMAKVLKKYIKMSKSKLFWVFLKTRGFS